MQGIAQLRPVQAVVLGPLGGLPVLLAHEQQLLAGVRPHHGQQRLGLHCIKASGVDTKFHITKPRKRGSNECFTKPPVKRYLRQVLVDWLQDHIKRVG